MFNFWWEYRSWPWLEMHKRNFWSVDVQGHTRHIADHLWMASSWPQPRQTQSLHGHSVRVSWDEVRWGDICGVNIPWLAGAFFQQHQQLVIRQRTSTSRALIRAVLYNRPLQGRWLYRNDRWMKEHVQGFALRRRWRACGDIHRQNAASMESKERHGGSLL